MAAPPNATDVQAFLRVISNLLGVPIQGDVAAHAATQALVVQLQQQVQTMSDNLNAKFDANDQKLTQLNSSLGSLEQRVAAQDSKLTAAQTERDAAVSELASTKQALADVQAQLAAIPQIDTAALEARLQAESDNLDGVINRLNAIDAAPVAAADTGSTPAADTNAPAAPAAPPASNVNPDAANASAAQTTVTEEQPSTDTNAPSGTSTAL